MSARAEAPAPTVPLMLAVREAADLLAVSPQTLRTLVAEGEIPAVKVHSLWRIAYGDLVAYVERLRREAQCADPPASLTRVYRRRSA